MHIYLCVGETHSVFLHTDLDLITGLQIKIYC